MDDEKCIDHPTTERQVFWCAECDRYRCAECEDAETCYHETLDDNERANGPHQSKTSKL